MKICKGWIVLGARWEWTKEDTWPMGQVVTMVLMGIGGHDSITAVCLGSSFSEKPGGISG